LRRGGAEEGEEKKLKRKNKKEVRK